MVSLVSEDGDAMLGLISVMNASHIYLMNLNIMAIPLIQVTIGSS